MSRRHPDIEAVLTDLARHITGPCPCGQDCGYVLAECCDVKRPRCALHEAGDTDISVCIREAGCGT